MSEGSPADSPPVTSEGNAAAVAAAAAAAAAAVAAVSASGSALVETDSQATQGQDDAQEGGQEGDNDKADDEDQDMEDADQQDGDDGDDDGADADAQDDGNDSDNDNDNDEAHTPQAQPETIPIVQAGQQHQHQQQSQLDQQLELPPPASSPARPSSQLPPASASTPTPASQSQSQSTPQKERHSLTLDQRRALRRWANAQLSRPSHKQCIEWFQLQYNQTISQSTVSHSLSPKYARLDGEPQLSGSRLRFGNWPEVEKLVLLWYQQMANAGRLPTNDELGEKAKSIFAQLPRHRGEEPPEFSPGWIHRFKKRYGLLIRRHRRQSLEASGATTDPASDVVYLMEAVQQGVLTVTAETRPAAIREALVRVLGIEPSLAVCERVRDGLIFGEDQIPGQAQTQTGSQSQSLSSSQAQAGAAASATAGTPGESHPAESYAASAATTAAAVVAAAANASSAAASNASANANANANANAAADYHGEDPEMVLQNALRQLQHQDSIVAEAQAAAVAAAAAAAVGQQHQQHQHQQHQSAESSADPANRPLRCPFCVNQRMLRTVKEAVEHMSTHVVV